MSYFNQDLLSVVIVYRTWYDRENGL